MRESLSSVISIGISVVSSLSLPRWLRPLFAPYPDYSGTFPPGLAKVIDDRALKDSVEELTRLVDQQWQASDQLAQRAGVVLGLFVATIAGTLAITRTLPPHFSWFDLGATTSILFPIGLGIYATRAQDIRIGPLPKDIANQATAPSEKDEVYSLLVYRLKDLGGNARLLNRSAAAYVLATLLFPIGVVLLLAVVLKGW